MNNRRETEDPVLLKNQESDNSTVGKSTKSSADSSKEKALPTKKKKKNPMLDYVELDLIGCGSFGRVVKVQKKTNGNQYAMKVIEKQKVEKVSDSFYF